MSTEFENIIIIPYRNRKIHLDYFIKNTAPLIEKYMPGTKVIVIEQEEGKLFNRGALLNAGFSLYKNKTKYFITHDVDLNPTQKFITEYYNSKPPENVIHGLFTSVCNTLGGIIKISSYDIHNINGFPNNFWGWGAEDTALQKRAEFYNKIISKFLVNDNSCKKEYLLRFNDINDRITYNNSKNHHLYSSYFPTLSKEKKADFIMQSGINNLEFRILSTIQLHNIVELTKVEI